MGAITLQTENAIYEIFMQKFHVDSYFQMRLTHVVEVGEGRKGRFKNKKKKKRRGGDNKAKTPCKP